jgi:DNA-binding LytR/AlgR family response regulator
MKPHVFIKREKEFVRINYDEIICIEQVGTELCITTERGMFLSAFSLNEFEKILPSDMFCRVSPACMISFTSIVSFDTDTIILIREKRVAYSQEYRSNLESGVQVFSMDPMLDTN